MKPIRLFIIFFLTASVIIPEGCKKNDDENTPVAVGYAGVISLEYSKGFPPFSTTVTSDVTVTKDNTVTFGAGTSQGFDSEDIKYDGGKPLAKVHMTGTVTFHSAKGEVNEHDGKKYLWVWVHTSVNGNITVWAWDDDQGWIQVIDTPYSYEDTYADGQYEFLVDDAVFGGAKIKKTLPDLEGTFTYGYTLQLVVIP